MQHKNVCGGPEAQRFEGDRGSNLVEYSMLLALIVIACLGAMTFFGNTATTKVSCVSSAIAEQIAGANC